VDRCLGLLITTSHAINSLAKESIDCLMKCDVEEYAVQLFITAALFIILIESKYDAILICFARTRKNGWLSLLSQPDREATVLFERFILT
jgi:hypothetical protein